MKELKYFPFGRNNMKDKKLMSQTNFEGDTHDARICKLGNIALSKYVIVKMRDINYHYKLENLLI